MSNRKLLLADDSVTIQKVVNLTFADEGIEVIAVGDGNSALSAFADHSPDILLLDVSMPGISGYDVCERIRKGIGRTNVPVILLVGSFEQYDQIRASEVGANAHITKPFTSIKNLVTMVTGLLAQSAAEAAAAAPVPQPAVPSYSDDLIDTYTPDRVAAPAPSIGADDILSGSELDSLLRGVTSQAAPAEDFDILDIPTEAKAKPAVQPAPPSAAQPFVPPPFDTPPPPPAFFGTPASPFQTPSSAPMPAAAPVPEPQPVPPPQQQATALTRADIEAIASALSQKLSEDVIREIAMKIVPEVTARIIEKMVEQAANRR